MTTRTDAAELIIPQTVYYQQPEEQIYWREFEQYPACNYTWTYSVYIHDNKRISLTSSPTLGLIQAEMEAFPAIDPPLMTSYSSQEKSMTVTSKAEE